MEKMQHLLVQFLERCGLQYEVSGKSAIRALVSGEHGKWFWVAGGNEEDNLLVSLSICPVQVPADRRAQVCEYINRANYGLRVGNFEMDFSDGEVRFRTTIPIVQDGEIHDEVQRQIFISFATFDQYIPGVLGVAFGQLTPSQAIKLAEDDSHSAPFATPESLLDDEDFWAELNQEYQDECDEPAGWYRRWNNEGHVN